MRKFATIFMVLLFWAGFAFGQNIWINEFHYDNAGTDTLEFVEVVWGDGVKTQRKIISATNTKPFGAKDFDVPVDLTNQKWVRFAAWDSAVNGAFTQPVHLR